MQPFRPLLRAAPGIRPLSSVSNHNRIKVPHHSPLIQLQKPQEISFFIDDKLLLNQRPLVEVINEVIVTLVQSQKPDTSVHLPLELVKSKWLLTKNLSNLHERLCSMYYSFFHSDLLLFKMVLKNPDLNLNLILQRYYQETCSSSNEGHRLLAKFGQFHKKNGSHTTFQVIPDEMWDLFKFKDYDSFVKNKVKGLLEIEICRHQEKVNGKGKNFIVTLLDRDLEFVNKLRQNSSGSVSLIKLQSGTKNQQALTRLIENFKFFERISDFKKMNFLYLQLLNNYKLINCDERQLFDILYVLERGSNLRS